MNYLLKNEPKRKSSEFKRALKITALFLILIFLFNSILPNIFFSIFGTIAKPFWSFRNSILSGPLLFLKNKNLLIQENNSLKKKILELNMENNAVISSSSPDSAAKVISHPPQSPYDVLVIDSDSRRLNAGQIIYSQEGVVLGKVIETSLNVSKVFLFSSGGIKTSAVLSNGTELVLEGRGGGNFFTKVPKDFSVSIGESLYLPGFREKLLARVIFIESNDQDSFKKVFLSYPINIFEIKWVLF